MKKPIRWWLFSFFLLSLFVGVGFYFFLPTRHRPDGSLLYGKIPIQKTVVNSPCVNVRIGGREILLKLDLGLSGYAMIDSSEISSIPDKEYIQQSWKYGIRGNKYYHDVYRIHEMKMGDLTFRQIVVGEENPKLKEEAIIILDPEKYDPADHKLYETKGTIGWALFQNTVLFLDMQNLSMVISGSIETFERREHSLEKYTRVPMHFKSGLLEIETTADGVPLQCILDTGATWNVRNVSNPNDLPIEEMAVSQTQISSFEIGDKQLGPMTFRTVPMSLPADVQAILGMEFFDNYRVVLDFKSCQFYFAKNGL